MITLMRYANLAFALVGAIVGAAAALFIPEAWGSRGREPEDAFLLIFWMVVAFLFAALSWLSARRMRSGMPPRSSPQPLFWANLLASTVCWGIVVLGFTSAQPSSVDLLLFAVPGLLFLSNSFLLWRGRYVHG